ncbi:MAG: 6-phosphogluconate dehydrogenase, decarboxylating [Succiniclasticum sp.]|jgi:6-phosphogluconate dehydrogenase
MKFSMGLIGLAVMGANLARNLARNKIPTLVFNRTAAKTEAFIQTYGNEYLGASTDLGDFCARLERPRRILLMVKAGAPVDQVLEQLLPHLTPGDIVIDGGNSFFQDTRRRTEALEAKGIHFVGMGISGGEEGALHGPSLMPGGSDASYKALEPVLKAIAAKAGGDPCVVHIGTDGAGHYVKMVHNGIEYADMQLIADVYGVMKNVLHMDHAEMQAVWQRWNQDRLSSYLVEITSKIMGTKDAETGKPLVECILDVAGQKGTGKWTSISALDLGVPTPTITEAVFARYLSAQHSLRQQAAQVLKPQAAPAVPDKETVLQELEAALYASKICAYAQGFSLMAAAAREYHWSLNFASIARIWRSGCIIRAAFLDTLSDIFQRQEHLESLLLDKHFSQVLCEAHPGWSHVTALAQAAGVPVPGLSSALSYFDMCRTSYTSANLIQAQRDFFGAHTYQRRDKEGIFHTEWEKA